MKEDLKRLGMIVSVFLCAAVLCACSPKLFKSPDNSDSTETTGVSESGTEISETTIPVLTSESETTTEPGPLTDEQALEGFTNYLYFKYKDLQKILNEGKYPCTWGIASSNEQKIMIMFKSYTGNLFRYHIDRKTGKTYATVYVVSSNSYVRTKESFNVKEYMNRKPTPTPWVIKPSGKQAVATPKPKVKVSSAVSKTSTVGKSKLPYKIPQVSISGKNTDAVNKRMKSDLSKYATSGSNARSITYSSHTGKRLVSILVHISDNDSKTVDTYKAYNISISTGKQVSDSAAVRLSGKSTKKFYAMVKSTYKHFGGGPSAPASFAKSARKKNLKRVSYKCINPYVSKNGHLCFIGYVSYYDDGEAKGYRLFDATKKKLLA